VTPKSLIVIFRNEHLGSPTANAKVIEEVISGR
jgi:hypothetical protein